MRTHKLFVGLLLSIVSLTSFCQTPTEMPTGKPFFIQSALNFGKNNGGYWDIPGAPTTIERGSNIQVWDLDAGIDRQFTLLKTGNSGIYEISIGNTHNVRVDIAGGNSANGTNVGVWDANGNNAQKFMFSHLGNGRFKIYDSNGKVVCLASRSNSNGSNVHIWDDHDGGWMEWYLIDATTKQPFIPQGTGMSDLPNNNGQIYVLQSGEEMVYGKIGLKDDGDIRYTFAMIRKPNPSKVVYNTERSIPYGGSDEVLSGKRVAIQNPKSYDLFDYWVIFNGKKFGPYDRVYELQLKYSNIDEWVSPDGKSIRFLAAVGDRYYLIMANNQLPLSVRSIANDFCFDHSSHRATIAIKWGINNYYLCEDGGIKLKEWKYIDRITYADNGKDLLYVGAETDFGKMYVYLNHQRIAGPFSAITHVGFLPGTSKPYYNGSNSGNDASLPKSAFTVGDQSIDSYPSTPGILNSHIVFSATKTVQGKNTHSIYDYNYSSDELKRYAGYPTVSNPILSKSSIYFSVQNAQGDRLLVKQDGTVIDKVTKAEYKSGYVDYKVSPDDDYYTMFGTAGQFKVRKNGKSFAPAGNKIFGVNSLPFNPVNGKLQMVIKKGQGVNRRIIYGDSYIDVDSDIVSEKSIVFAPQSNDIFTLRRVGGSNYFDYKVQLYKNNTPLSESLWTSVSEFIVSPDGKRHAALVTENLVTDFVKIKYSYYWTENDLMDIKRILIVDGERKGTNYGLPVWSDTKGKFLVLMEVNGEIRMVEL